MIKTHPYTELAGEIILVWYFQWEYSHSLFGYLRYLWTCRSSRATFPSVFRARRRCSLTSCSWIFDSGPGFCWCFSLRNPISVSINILCVSSQLPARSLSRILEVCSSKALQAVEPGWAFLGVSLSSVLSAWCGWGCGIPKTEICKYDKAARGVQGWGRGRKVCCRVKEGMSFRIKSCWTFSHVILHSTSSPGTAHSA